MLAVLIEHRYERCVEALPERGFPHVMEDDSLGFTRIFAVYPFTLTL